MTTEPSLDLLRERLRENRDAQPLTARCALCPGWEASGTAAEARELALEHRRSIHPETIRPGRGHRVNKKFSRHLTAEREQEINEERRVRIRALGLDIEIDG